MVSRGIEHESRALTRRLGTGVVAWSPLGRGLVSGQYRPHAVAAEQNPSHIRTTAPVTTPALSKLTAQNWAAVVTQEQVATEIGLPMAQVAVHWAANRPRVTAMILGATRIDQLKQALPMLDLVMPLELGQRLDQADRVPPVFPYAFIDVAPPRMHGGEQALLEPPRFAEDSSGRGGGWR